MAPKAQLADTAGEEINAPIVTLPELLRQQVQDHPDNIALICRQQSRTFLNQAKESSNNEQKYLRWTYRQLYDAASIFAAKLHSLGVRRGMRIVAFLRNGAQWPVGFWAASLLGCAYVAINASFADKPDDAQHMSGVADSTVAMVWDAKMAKDLDQSGGELMKGMIAKFVCSPAADDELKIPAGWSSFEDVFNEDEKTAEVSSSDETKMQDEDLALVIFTSGTTSKPKGVMHKSRNIVSSAHSAPQALEMDSSSRCSNSLPLFHIFAIHWSIHCWSVGGTVCYPSASFDPAASLSAIQDEKLTHLPGPPSLLSAIADHPAAKDTNLESLQLLVTGAAVILPDFVKSVCAALRCKRLVTPFGMSEGTPITYHPWKNLPVDFGDEAVSNGLCCPGARARICAPGSRDILKRGELGELHIGGRQVVPGYIGKDSDELYIDDGSQWMMTGDQAKMDENGELYIVGRYKDVIIRAGENISPASIEAVLDSMPGITSQVVGVEDEVAGEVPVAVIKLAEGADLDEDEMHGVVSEKLGTVFSPAHTITVQDIGMDDFPRTESGKYQKFELRGPVAEYVSSKDTSGPGTPSSGSSSHKAALHQIWAKLLGMSTEKLAVSSSLEDFADSITVMRASSKIKRELGQKLDPDDMIKHPTIESQAELLDSRDHTFSTSEAALTKARDGPPQLADVAHALGSEELYAKMQTDFAKVGEELGLKWEQDVVDVLPVWDWGQAMLRGPRAQSWNHRHAFAATKATPEQLRSALEQALENQAMLRTLAIRAGDSQWSHVIIRSTPRWYKHVVTTVDAVGTAEDLKRLVLDDARLDFAAVPGPLFRVVIAPIKDTDTCGLVYQAHHSCFDGISIPNLVEDLKIILDQGSVAPRESYKGWADNTFLHRTSVQARVAVDFHAKRLQGLSKVTDSSLWPHQRAPEWFKGNFFDIAGQFPSRKPLDGDESIGADGVKNSTSLSGVQQLKQDQNLSAPAILKTALALLNCHYTSSKQAIFTNYEAGRDWAFQESWIANMLPNAMDINGPTLEAVLNKISIDPQETCLELMKRVSEEQKLLTKYSHAPLFEIQKQLGEDDGKDLIDIMRRQIFNCLPGLGEQEEEDSPLKWIQMQSRSDVGILWNCGMVGEEFHVTASYDDCQLRRTEVEEAVERWFRIAGWITKRENWDRKVGECPDL